MADPHIYTYHCLCTELLLATFAPLQHLPKRKGDGAKICKIAKSDLPTPEAVVLSGSTLNDDTPVVLKLEDGFEKRYHLHCTRCDLKIGYRLDKAQFDSAQSGVEASVLYLYPGGLLGTEDMKERRNVTGQLVDFSASAG